MAEEKKENDKSWIKYAVILGAVLIIFIAILAMAFTFFLPTWFPADAAQAEMPPDIPEVGLRLGIVVVTVVMGMVFVAGIVMVIWEWFFKKKELHIVKEHQKIVKQAAQLNPVSTMRNLVLTGKHQVQAYDIGRIVGYTQIPVHFSRMLHIEENGRIDENKSETIEQFEARKTTAKADSRDKYDFFAFVTQRGLYALPFFSLLEPVKVFACYPAERASDLLGDVEIYDVGTWKVSGVNLFVPGQRSEEPMSTIQDMKGQLMPIAYMSIIDYVGLIAQRGIEGDTSMQKWLQAKSTTLNVKENA